MVVSLASTVLMGVPPCVCSWGFDCMGGDDKDMYDLTNDQHYLRYVVARLAACAQLALH